jgi:hypothetical protein
MMIVHDAATLCSCSSFRNLCVSVQTGLVRKKRIIDTLGAIVWPDYCQSVHFVTYRLKNGVPLATLLCEKLYAMLCFAQTFHLNTRTEGACVSYC